MMGCIGTKAGGCCSWVRTCKASPQCECSHVLRAAHCRAANREAWGLLFRHRTCFNSTTKTIASHLTVKMFQFYLWMCDSLGICAEAGNQGHVFFKAACPPGSWNVLMISVAGSLSRRGKLEKWSPGTITNISNNGEACSLLQSPKSYALSRVSSGAYHYS